MTTVFFYMLLGLAAVIVSAVAMRQKLQGLIITGWILVGLLTLIIVTHLRFVAELFQDQLILVILVLGGVYVIPILFLVKAVDKKSSAADSFDGSTAGGKVTEEYLDEVINAPDEDIDFGEDLDLR